MRGELQVDVLLTSDSCTESQFDAFALLFRGEWAMGLQKQMKKKKHNSAFFGGTFLSIQTDASRARYGFAVVKNIIE